MGVRATPLGRIVEGSAGFMMSDVAFLTDLNESTLSRLWDDPNWLDRISGKSLQAIVSAVPRVGEYIVAYALVDRRTRLADNLSGHGVTVDREAFTTLTQDHGIPEQCLSNALNAAVAILTGDVSHAAAWLARFWEQNQDRALGHLLGTSDGPQLLVDPNPLISASVDLADQLARRTNSFHAIVGRANLTHHLARVSGISAEVPDITRQTALSYRSSVMGRVIAANDFDLIMHYCSLVDAKPFLSAIEEWAFPTYTHDVRVTHDFSLPRSFTLRRTASEVLREIKLYNDAYLYYLVTVVVPTLLRRDANFGACLAALKKGLHDRLEYCDEIASRDACAALLGRIERDLLSEGVSSFDKVW